MYSRRLRSDWRRQEEREREVSGELGSWTKEEWKPNGEKMEIDEKKRLRRR